MRLLSEYLDAIGYANLYRYIVTAGLYVRSPRAITAWSRDAVLAVETYFDGALEGRRLAWTLLAGAPVALDALDSRERSVAGALGAAGVLALRDGHVFSSRYQLLCVEQLYVFVDARVNFPSAPHEVYIGDDTSSLLYYAGGVKIDKDTRALDLGTGTGIIGLSLAHRGARATLTDIAPAALALARINAELNGLIVDLREESFELSLTHGTWDVITCNPPYVAVPEDLTAPVFARGGGADGLDQLRRILERLPDLLSERGEALFVADFLGDEARPFVLRDLEPFASDFAIDVYVDAIGPIANHVAALAKLVRDERLDETAARQRLHEHLVDRPGARNMFLAVVRVRRGPPGLAIYNRWLKLSAASRRPVSTSDA